MIVTGTKLALTKLASRVGVEVQENARTRSLFVSVPCVNADLCLSADARSNGSVSYRTVDGANHTAATQAEFLMKCRGGKPGIHPGNVQRFYAAGPGGLIVRL